MSQSIQKYLDSSTYYLNAKRPDRVLYFNQLADSMANADVINDFQTLYDIQYNYSWIFKFIGRKNLFLKHTKNIGQLIAEARKEDNAKNGLYVYYLNSKAAYFIQSDNIDSALFYFKEAYAAAIKFEDNLYAASSLNNQGIFQLKLDSIKSALNSFHKALEYIQLENERDSGLYASIHDNIADVKLKEKDTLSAINLIGKNLFFLNDKKIYRSSKIRWGLKLLHLYHLQKTYVDYPSLLLLVDSLLRPTGSEDYFKNKIQLLELNLLYHQRFNNQNVLQALLTEKLDLQEQYLLFKAKENKKIKQLLSTYMESVISNQLKKSEIKIQKAKSEEILVVSISIIIIVVISSLLLLIIKNYKRRLKLIERDQQIQSQKIEIERLEKEKMQRELEDQTKDFSKIFMQVSLQENWATEIIDKLKALKSHESSAMKEEIGIMVRELKQKTTVYEKIGQLQKGMDKANASFFRKLDERFPDLSKSERDTCGLIRLNLDSKEIAAIRNIHPSSVRKLRQRIRVKLHLEAEQDLHKFIIELA